MRLDVFLKTSRLIPRRSLAQKFCSSGLVMIDGVETKASKEVKTGDEIEIARGTKRAKYRVLNVPSRKQMSKSEAAGMTELIGETELDEFHGLSPDLT
ncbi:hypothetical protein BH24ACI3_BH24ACI3_01380 [soil metagenome]